MELCIQLCITMLGKQLIQNNLFEIGIPWVYTFMCMYTLSPSPQCSFYINHCALQVANGKWVSELNWKSILTARSILTLIWIHYHIYIYKSWLFYKYDVIYSCKNCNHYQLPIITKTKNNNTAGPAVFKKWWDSSWQQQLLTAPFIYNFSIPAHHILFFIPYIIKWKFYIAVSNMQTVCIFPRCRKLKKLLRRYKSKRDSKQEEEFYKTLARHEKDHFLDPYVGLNPEYMEMSESLDTHTHTHACRHEKQLQHGQLYFQRFSHNLIIPSLSVSILPWRFFIIRSKHRL